jgi:hypothetical protein
MSKEETIEFVRKTIENSGTKCGCIHIFGERLRTTVKFGDCTNECEIFHNCPSSDAQYICDACREERDQEQAMNNYA